jgi:hypothetical protein
LPFKYLPFTPQSRLEERNLLWNSAFFLIQPRFRLEERNYDGLTAFLHDPSDPLYYGLYIGGLKEKMELEQLQERKRFRKWKHVYAPPPPKARSSSRWQR